MKFIDDVLTKVWFFTQIVVVAISMVYMIAEFAHPNDTEFGRSIISRIIIWLGFTMSFLPIMLVHLDFSNSRTENQDLESSGFSAVWLTTIFCQSMYVFVVCPLMIVFYESNERLSIFLRVKKALKAQMPLFLSIIIFIVFTSFFARNVTIPEIIANEILGKEANYESKDGTKYYQVHTDFAEHIIISTSFIGWLLFVIFAGVGFTALPWDLILDYQYRPKPIDEGNFNDRTKLLLQYALDLREMGKKLDEDRNYVL